MAAPTRVQSNAGAVITATSGVISLTGCVAGNVVIFQICQDGTGAQNVPDTITNVETLSGSDNNITQINTPTNSCNIGNPNAGFGSLYIARVLANGTVSVNTQPTGGDDLYTQIHEFTNVNTGTTLAAVLENGTAGVAVDAAATSTSIADVGVTTLGVDSLACNFGFINDDATGIASFAGETGGDWTMVASFESATGTDGTVFLQTAAMAAAGTIDGGADTITSDGWGVRGFALIGTTVEGPATSLIYPPRPVRLSL